MKRLNLIESCKEFTPRSSDNINKIPWYTRGVYELLKEEDGPKRTKLYRVVYIGMGTGHAGIRGRIHNHAIKWNRQKWSHFSYFEVWHNIPDIVIGEIESLFLYFFRKHKKRGGQTLKLNSRLESRKLKRLSEAQVAQ